MQQRSAEWKKARLGHITASAADAILSGARQGTKDAVAKAKILSKISTVMTIKELSDATELGTSTTTRLAKLMVDEGTLAEGGRIKRSMTYRPTGKQAAPEPETKLSGAALTYAYELIAERITGQSREISSAALEWGTAWEASARKCCSEREGLEVQEPTGEFAFVARDPWIGASPDGMIGHDGLVEIQCPYSASESVRTRVEGYKASGKQTQMQFQMWVLRRQWNLFVSFDPRFPDPYYSELVYRDEEFIGALADRVFAFRDAYLELYCQLLGVPF